MIIDHPSTEQQRTTLAALASACVLALLVAGAPLARAGGPPEGPGDNGADGGQAAVGPAETATAGSPRATPPAGSRTQIPARGSVKVKNVGDPVFPPSEVPHLDCVFEVHLYGFDVDEATIALQTHPPTSPSGESLHSETVALQPGAPPGNEHVGMTTVDLSDELTGGRFSYHEQQGFHIRLTVRFDGHVKHKVFWVDCPVRPGGVGALEVLKEADDAPEGAEFSFTVTCPEAGLEESFVLAAGDGRVLDDLEAGTVCVVTETDPAGADDIEIGVDPSDAVVERNPDGITVTITPDTTVTVTFTNVFAPVRPGQVGALEVLKTVDGSPPADAAFAFTVDCAGVALGEDAAFTLGASGSRVLDDIPVGSECVVTETDHAGADDVAIGVDPDQARVSGDSAQRTVTVRVRPRATVTVTFENVFEAADVLPQRFGAVQVVKDAEDPPEGAAFTFTITCPDVDETVTLAAGEASRPVLAPVGSQCTVTETGHAGADEVHIAVDPDAAVVATDPDARSVTVTVSDQATVVAAFTNVFAEQVGVGDLLVTKTVAGDDAPPEGTEFLFTVDCAGVDLGAGARLTLTHGQTAVFDELPAGTACTISETDSQGADEVVVTGADTVDGATATVTVADERVTVVTYTNVFPVDVEVLPITITPPAPPAAPVVVPPAEAGAPAEAVSAAGGAAPTGPAAPAAPAARAAPAPAGAPAGRLPVTGAGLLLQLLLGLGALVLGGSLLRRSGRAPRRP